LRSGITLTSKGQTKIKNPSIIIHDKSSFEMKKIKKM